MNKSELIDRMASHAGINKTEAGAALDAFLTAVTDTLKAGDSLALLGFGSFEVAERAARTGRNPATGAEIQIAASRTPKFRPGKALKDALK